MKKTSPLFLYLILLFVAIYSCKPKEEDTPAPAPVTPSPTKTSMLISKRWGMSAFAVSPAFVITIPGLGSLPISDLYTSPAKDFPQAKAITDDTLIFSAANTNALNGTFVSEANTKLGTEKDGSGTWVANADFSQITITDNANSETIIFKIIEFKDKLMRIQTTRKNPIDLTDTKDYTASITYNSK